MTQAENFLKFNILNVDKDPASRPLNLVQVNEIKESVILHQGPRTYGVPEIIVLLEGDVDAFKSHHLQDPFCDIRGDASLFTLTLIVSLRFFFGFEILTGWILARSPQASRTS